MNPLWLLEGPPDAPGWAKLQRDHQSGAVDVLHLDRDSWALVYAAEAPAGYDGLRAMPPRDGAYLDQFGRPCYVSGCREVHSARAVLSELGDDARAMLDKVGDPDLALERLGRVF